MTTLVLVPPDKIEAAWPHVRVYGLRMVETSGGKLTEADALAMLRSDLLQMHVALDEKGQPKAVMVTELVRYPQKKVCKIAGIAGENREDWMHHLAEIEAWAASLGCQSIRIEDGRKGWLREERLKPYRVKVAFERDLP